MDRQNNHERKYNMTTILTRAQAHAMVMRQLVHHPGCLDSQDKWDSYEDKPFGWAVAEWCIYSPDALRCACLTQCINGLLAHYKIPNNLRNEIWEGTARLLEMLNEEMEVK